LENISVILSVVDDNNNQDILRESVKSSQSFELMHSENNSVMEKLGKSEVITKK
jgi:hypothetical protein